MRARLRTPARPLRAVGWQINSFRYLSPVKPLHVVRALVDIASSRARGLRVRRAAIGSYAYVELEDGRAGVAFVDWDWVNPFRRYRDLPEEAEEAVRLALSYDPIEAAYGVATINALHDTEGIVEADPLDLVELRPGMRVSMVGYIRGYVRRLSNKGVELRVFELRPVEEDSSVLPWYAEEELLPGSNLVIVTGVAVVNKTIDRLLELARGAQVIVSGPTTPMIAAAFPGLRGALGGSVVSDREKAYKMITMGYGADALLHEKVLHKVTLPLSEGSPGTRDLG